MSPSNKSLELALSLFLPCPPFSLSVYQIMDGLRFSIHKQYSEFMKRNPHFSGTVSVFAHSLGSVLVYDLLQETCEERGVQHSDIQPNTGGHLELVNTKFRLAATKNSKSMRLRTEGCCAEACQFKCFVGTFFSTWFASTWFC